MEDIKSVYEEPLFEVKLDAVFYDCQVFDVNHESNQVEIITAYRPQSISVPFEDVYFKRKDTSESFNIRVGLEVEALLKAENPEQFGWRKGVIKSIKGSECIVNMYDVSSPSCYEIVELENLRPPTSGPTLSQDNVQRNTVTIPENVRSFFKKYPKACQSLKKYIRAFTIRVISVSELLVISDYKLSLERMNMLCDYYFMNLALNNIKYTKKLFVPSDLVKYAIGKEGQNMRKAEQVKGVIYIRFDNINTFEIFGKSEGSVRRARRILNCTMETVTVPLKMIGHIIGDSCSSIQKLVTNNNVSITIRVSENFVDLDTAEEYFEMDIIGSKRKIDTTKFCLEKSLEIQEELKLLHNKKQARIKRAVLAAKSTQK